MTTDTIEQIDALLHLDAQGTLTTPIPRLARDLLAKCREHLIAPRVMKSTPEMRARIRELMSPEQDQYDLAVAYVLEDLEEFLKPFNRS